MNPKNQLFLSTSSLVFNAKALLIDKMRKNHIAKLYIHIMVVVLLLMSSNVSGNAPSAVIDDIKADMQYNEALLLNAPVGPTWAVKAYMGMGNAPRGDATPPWWTPDNTTYKSSLGWDVITPWFVIYPGVGNAAKNVRVKVYGIIIYMLDKSTNKWIKIDTGLGKPTWGSNYDFNMITWKSKATTRVESDGAISYKLTPDSYPVHGGFNKMDIAKYIDPLNIGAVFMSVKSQLILDNPLGVDDRASAKILINIGADYYPLMTTTIADLSPMQYVPAVGGTRFGLVKTVPRSHYFATIDSGSVFITQSDYIKNGGSVMIPVDQFESNMPPYLLDTAPPSAPTSPSSAVIKKTASSASINLSWKAATDNVGVLGYNVYKNGKLIGSTTLTSYTDSISTPPKGALYSYTFRAFDEASNLSDLSSAALATY